MGIPHGPFVRLLSKKSKSYCRAGGYVRATWPSATCWTHATTTTIATRAKLLVLCENGKTAIIENFANNYVHIHKYYIIYVYNDAICCVNSAEIVSALFSSVHNNNIVLFVFFFCSSVIANIN